MILLADRDSTHRMSPPEGYALGLAHRCIDEVRSHPRFAEAHDCLVDELLKLYGSDKRLIRGLVEYNRAVSFMVIICLDAMYVPEDVSTYVTRKRLTEALTAMRVTGARRIGEFVTKLSHEGFLTFTPAPGDARVKILRPTEKMLRTDRAWLEAFHKPLALLYLDPIYAGALQHDPAYQAAYRRNGFRTFEIAWKIMQDTRHVFFFLDSEVGFRILMRLIQTARSEPSRRSPAGFYTTAAECSGVSRTHVRNILRKAAERGLVALSDPPGKFVEVLPKLEANFELWVAMSLSAVDLACRIAMADLATRADAASDRQQRQQPVDHEDRDQRLVQRANAGNR